MRRSPTATRPRWQLTSLAGLVTFNSSNTYNGGTAISGGTLVAGANTALGSGAVNISGPGMLDVLRARHPSPGSAVGAASFVGRWANDNLTISGGGSFGGGISQVVSGTAAGHGRHAVPG